MMKDINQETVQHVSTSTVNTPGHSLVSVFIHHKLTPEQQTQLTDLVESLAIKAITTWASL